MAAVKVLTSVTGSIVGSLIALAISRCHGHSCRCPATLRQLQGALKPAREAIALASLEASVSNFLAQAFHQSQPILASFVFTDAAYFSWCELVTICKPDIPRRDQSSVK